ncbi:MAG: RNA-binding protein [Burkholderiaceae bacterium]|nr:RNA-binding protein [Burkholderiaceae bacterium]
MTTEPADDTGGERLAKRVAALARCSRSEAERYIEGGYVLVDGQVIDEPAFRVREETVALAPDATLLPQPPVTLVLHKPAGVPLEDVPLSIDTRWPGDPMRLAPLRRHFRNLYCAAPLPPRGSGLVVFTQDNRIARRLEEDAAFIEQECIVDVRGELSPEGLALLNHGLVLRGRELPPAKVSWQSENRLRFALKGIAPAQVPAMCHAVGIELLGLRRIRLGRVPMAALPVGQWRYLQPRERF